MEGKKEKILIIEDDAGYRQMLYDSLREEGYYVLAEASTQHAQDWAFNQDMGKFDMVISDQRMPVEMGAPFLQLLSQLEKVDPGKLDPDSKLYRELRERFRNLDETQFQVRLREMKVHPAIRVILSGYAEDDSVSEGLKLGVIHKFISKKLSMEEILTLIRDLLKQHKASLAPSSAPSP